MINNGYFVFFLMSMILLVVVVISAVLTKMIYPSKKEHLAEMKENQDRYERDQKKINELKEFCDIGNSFYYLGVKMTVIDLYETKLFYQSLSVTVRYLCDYVDNNGVIRQIKIYHNMLDELKAGDIRG